MVAWRLFSLGAFKIHRQLVLVSGTGFLLMLGLGVLFPVLPYYREFGLSELQIGMLMSSYAFASVVMAPIWGRFSDRFGRKPALLIGLVGFSLGFGLFALASGFWQWLAARTLGGLLAAAALPTILSYTADITPPERRNVALGTVGASIGLGVLFGPAFGGAVAGYGLAAPFVLSSAIGAFAAVAVALLLPESLTPEIREQARERRAELRRAGLGRRRIALGLAPFLSYSLLAQTSRTGLETTVGFLVADRLAGGPAQVGLLLAAAGTVAVLVQGGGLRGLARRFDDHALMRAGTLLQLVGLVGLPVFTAMIRFASLGYAVPGAVLAIGVIIPMAWFDNQVDAFARATFGVSTGLLLSGTIAAVTFGYLVRFLALSFGTIEASLAKVTDSMDGAARTLGSSPADTLRRVHLPMMRGSVLTAGILVFVDCMKELPMTMILRPFDFHTLATFVHQYASDELLAESSLAALTIVASGILPVILLSYTIARSRPGHRQGGG